MTNGREPNRLIYEKSPYLLQHAYNPVDWYPWGEEAFEKARSENKPIFLSIGYSTCHWCHVMERESFEREDIAKALNRAFVCVKVDREERPDVDAIYMNVCQMMTGSGGWPLSIFLDSDKKPFFAGTYFPRQAFLALLDRIDALWNSERDTLNQYARQIFEALRPKNNKAMPISDKTPDEVFASLKNGFDPVYGGFSNAPKFPSPHTLLFLIRYYQTTGSKEALAMCGKTLEGMRRGGIFDHIGFGFSRYSTDQKWLVPHFEKMLYDNALLCMAFSEYASVTNDELCKNTAREIITYLKDRMRSPEGGFYSAEDADSEGVEGKFYVFSSDEVRQVLKDDAEEFCRYFDISEQGNFEGKNIPNLIRGPVPPERREFAENCRKALYAYRENRVRPHLDDKILTSWNGLVIAALSIAGRVLHDAEVLDLAAEAVGFIRSRMAEKDGRVKARYRDGEARFLGYDEDYAYLTWGLIELYLSTFEDSYLEFAISLTKSFIDKFYDKKGGGFFQNDEDSEKMPVRLKASYDGATPSANAVAVYNLIRLSRLTHSDELSQLAEKTIEAFMGEISSYPAAYAFHAINILYLKNGGCDVVLRAKDRSKLSGFLEAVNEASGAFMTVKIETGAEETPKAYVCRGFSCAPPVSTAEELKKLL